MSGILLLLTNLPKIIYLLPSLIEMLTRIVGSLEKAFGPDWPKKLDELSRAVSKAESAKTSEDIKDAAKDFSKFFNS